MKKNFQLNIVTFHGDIQQMSLKNRRSIGEFFSFHVNPMALISFYFKRACQDAGHHRAIFLS